MQEEGTVAGSLYTGLKTQWTGDMGKAVEMEFSRIPQGVEITRGSKWKAKRAAEWEVSRVEASDHLPQQHEMFVQMETRGVELVKSPARGTVLGMGQTVVISSPPLPQPMALDQVCRDGREQENGWDFTSGHQAVPTRPRSRETSSLHHPVSCRSAAWLPAST